MTSARSHSASKDRSSLQQPQDDTDLHRRPCNEEYNAPIPSKSEKEAYHVDWEPNDPENPRNWSPTYKGWLTLQLGMLALASSLGSSIISPANNAISKYAHISPEVATLSLSLYVLGFAFGPLLWGPIGEVLLSIFERS